MDGDLKTRERASVYTSRARYFDSETGFNLETPPVPCRHFLAERDRARDPATGTALIALDQSAAMGLEFPATTPLVLARYGRIRDGETLTTDFNASGVIHYVIEGQGDSRQGSDRIPWRAGDIFCLPPGEVRHRAQAGDALLWIVTNEPLLAFEQARAPDPAAAPAKAVHFTREAIADELAAAHRRLADKAAAGTVAGLAVVFSSEDQAHRHNLLPTLTLALNQLPPGQSQPAHRHNSVAVSLTVAGEGGYSMVDGARIDWAPDAVMVTPPGADHSHHNDGRDPVTWLIVQDGGLHYHCRTMDFAFT